MLILFTLLLITSAPIFIAEELLGAYSDTPTPTKEQWRNGNARYQL